MPESASGPQTDAIAGAATESLCLTVLRFKSGCNKRQDRFFPFRLMAADHVYGVELAGQPPLRAGEAFPVKMPRALTETTVTLPKRQAERLYEFYEEFFTGPRKPPQTWNQYSFVRRVCGVTELPFGAALTLPAKCGEAVDAHAALDMGGAYAIRQHDRAPAYTNLIAAEGGSLTLSVVGWNKFLIVAEREAIFRQRYGASMHRIDLHSIDQPANYSSTETKT